VANPKLLAILLNGGKHTCDVVEPSSCAVQQDTGFCFHLSYLCENRSCHVTAVICLQEGDSLHIGLHCWHLLMHSVPCLMVATG